MNYSQKRDFFADTNCSFKRYANSPLQLPGIRWRVFMLRENVEVHTRRQLCPQLVAKEQWPPRHQPSVPINAVESVVHAVDRRRGILGVIIKHCSRCWPI